MHEDIEIIYQKNCHSALGKGHTSVFQQNRQTYFIAKTSSDIYLFGQQISTAKQLDKNIQDLHFEHLNIQCHFQD